MKKSFLLLPLAFALLFAYLFHGQQAGINILIFNVLLISMLIRTRRLSPGNRFHLIFLAGAGISGIMVAVYGEGVALAGNILSLMVLCAVAAYPAMVVPLNAMVALPSAILTGPREWLRAITAEPGGKSGTGRVFRKGAMWLLPLIVFALFMLIYSAASPFFNKFTGNFLQGFSDLMQKIFRWISPGFFWLMIVGFALYLFYFFGTLNYIFRVFSEEETDRLTRRRKPFSGRFNALKNEYRSGIILLILLNLALALMNVLDIRHVWLFFEWDGGYLKQFVHEGTWLLIVSILISIVIVVWLFRGNLNFYSKNRVLLVLSRIWLYQNIILAISVAVRNFWYIHYFNLAFKRIWVFAFLILVVFGIITVLLKLRHKKTLQYLLVQNSLMAYAVIVFTGLFNWDIIIARYNVKHAGKAFFHTDFMMHLDSSTLPVLRLDAETLSQIDSVNRINFPDHQYYTSMDYYSGHIGQRTRNFLEGYPRLQWQSLTVSDAITYQRLK